MASSVSAPFPHAHSPESSSGAAPTLVVFTPAGVLLKAAPLKLALRRLQQMGFDARADEAALAKFQRFGGDDETRLAALHRVAQQAPSVALASRGGYGLTRLLDRIDWPLLARAVERGTRWVGYSDLTALQLGLLAHTGAGSWAGPLACDHFGRSEAEGGVDEITRDVFLEAMSGELEALGFRCDAGHDGLEVTGTLWGGNLAMVTSLLGTRHWPKVKGGVLFLEDVGEPVYRIERLLLQLAQAGVMGAQKAVILGQFTDLKASPLDRGFSMKTLVEHLRQVVSVPILTGLPHGHVRMSLSLPVGRRVQLVVERRQALLAWGH